MSHYLGLDIGGTTVKVGLMDGEYNLIARHSIPTQPHLPFEAVAKNMADAVLALVDKAGMRMGDFESLGVGVPSGIHPKTGRVVFANNLGWRDVDLAGALQNHLGLPVLLANDADCAALAEALAGAGKGSNNLLMLTLGTGVGGGVVLNKRIFTGADGYGTEPGHIILVHEGVQCTCGQKGCLEMYASATGLVRITKEAMAKHPESLLHEEAKKAGKVSGRTAFFAAQRGDAAGQSAVDLYTDLLACGISGMVNILRPDIVVIGGGISNEGDNFILPLEKAVHAKVYASDLMPPPPVVGGLFGGSGGMVGAALLGAQG